MSRAARQAGVRLGMRRGGVLALAPEARLHERDTAREAERLKALALALMRFTPQVVLAPEATVLADVSASLRLFGGVRQLSRLVRATTQALALTHRLALAPTGSGAWLLARRGRLALKPASLERQAREMPLAVLPEARPFADWLTELGCESLGDVLKLPRAGLSRRCGPHLLEALDRILGNAADLFDWLEAPVEFNAKQELPDWTERVDPILASLEGLVAQLSGWLSIHQYAVTCVRLTLDHARRTHEAAPTLIEVALAEPARQGAHLLRLFSEKLARTELVAPVIAVTLCAVSIEPAQLVSEALFPDPGGSPADHLQLLELLRTRLGEQGLRRPAPLADHRPEIANAWLPGALQCGASAAAHLPRPAWLLEKPIPLLTRHHRPFYGSPLALVSPAERLEAGWWNGTMVRDYFVAQGADHVCYWIYRERIGAHEETDPRWFLHGLFG